MSIELAISPLFVPNFSVKRHFLRAHGILVYREFARDQNAEQILLEIDKAWQEFPYVFLCLSYNAGVKIAGATPPPRETTGDPAAILIGFRELRLMEPEEHHSKDSAYLTAFNFRATLSDGEFQNAVEKAIELMKEGEFYVINLSRALVFNWEGEISPALMRRYPARYSFMLKGERVNVLSFSPELFLRAFKGEIISVPMKGTRPLKHGQHLKLASDEKEKSENLMIVDLMRSDLGKIAEIGTVKVPRLWQVKKYGNVFQMTSTVRAKIKTGISISHILKATFPPGSVTGAPKKRVMDAISALEMTDRGIYCGCSFLKTPGGDFTSSVLIRTIILHSSGTGRYHTGAGITVESNPRMELEELSWKEGPLSSVIGFKEKWKRNIL